MKKYQLGEFEEIVILTIGVLYQDAYELQSGGKLDPDLPTVSMGALIRRLYDGG